MLALKVNKKKYAGCTSPIMGEASFQNVTYAHSKMKKDLGIHKELERNAAARIIHLITSFFF